MRWDLGTDRTILLAILETHKITVDYEAVAHKIGNGCTAAAVYQQVNKLKKMAQTNKDIRNKPTTYQGSRGGIQKGYFDDSEENTKDIKPMVHLRQQIKVEQLETVVKKEQVLIKQDGGQQESQMPFPSIKKVVIIS